MDSKRKVVIECFSVMLPVHVYSTYVTNNLSLKWHNLVWTSKNFIKNAVGFFLDNRSQYQLVKIV